MHLGNFANRPEVAHRFDLCEKSRRSGTLSTEQPTTWYAVATVAATPAGLKLFEIVPPVHRFRSVATVAPTSVGLKRHGCPVSDRLRVAATVAAIRSRTGIGAPPPIRILGHGLCCHAGQVSGGFHRCMRRKTHFRHPGSTRNSLSAMA